ncbi:MAG: PAS domain S-box protein [Polyangiaceae bacterium]
MVTERESVHESLRASEELLRTFFEQSAVGFAHIDAASGRLLRVNEKLCEMSGRTRDELVVFSWQELIHPDELRSSFESVGRLLSGAEKTVTNEVRFIRGDGAVRWIRAAVSCMNLPEGPLSLIVIAEDVTEKRRTEDALREAESRLATVFRLSPVPIAIIRWADRRYIDVNETFTAVFGWSKNEVLGKTPAQLGIQPPEEDIVSGADAPSLSQRLSSLGSVTSAEVVLRNKSGQELICLASVAFADISGERCVVGFFRDVTRARALDESLRRSAAELRAMFDVAPVGIAQTDPANGRFIHVNPRMCEITGYSAEELYAMKARELTHPEDLDRHTQLYGAVARGELEGYRLEKRYVCKGGRVAWVDVNLTVLHDPSGRRSLIVAVADISERLATARELAEAKEQQRIALDAAGLGTWRHEIAQGRMLLDERAMLHLGFDRSDVSAAEVFARIHPDDLQTVRQGVAKVHDPRGDGAYAGETRVVLPSGEVRWLSVNVQGRFEGQAGERRAISTVVTSRDITDTKRAEQRQRDTEDQLRAAQKMEAVGRLAGGVAHDFNNLLSVILSYSEAASIGLGKDDPLRADLGEIVRAAERAEGLTAQLMAFSRHQVWRPQSLDIHALVQGIAKMMRRLIGEDIELQISAEGDLYRTRADPGQIEQVLMNLAVNARDAMPDGGRLAIAMANVEIGASRASALQVDPGPYLLLSVSDTGCGMDPVTLARAFDPFFTTKGVGKGTGLGLSTVYGIVRQSGGAIVAESALAAGATFRIYLKRDDGTQERAPGSVPALRAAPGGETVLVVEDEEALRKVVCRVLTGAGYKVLVAADAAEALLLGEQRGSEVSLVLTDVIMPGMNGRQLVQRLFPRCPAAKVMFMSGYADDAIERLDVLGHDFLRKPFNGETLVRKVRAVLDGRATAE